MQVFTYFRLFPNERRVGAFVILVVLLNIARGMQEFDILWDKFVLNFGNYNKADWANESIWTQATEPITTELICAAVQCFFALRVFRLYNRNWLLLGVIMIPLTMGFISALVLIVYMYGQRGFLGPILTCGMINLASVVACDMLISLSVFAYLIKQKVNSPSAAQFRRTDTLIDRALTITWVSAAPPALCAVINIAMYVPLATKNWDFITPNLFLPHLYSIALMYTINSRGSIFPHIDKDLASATPSATSDATAYSGSSRRNSKVSPVRVRTQTEVLMLQDTPSRSADKFQNASDTC